MIITTLDVETTYHEKDNGTVSSPFEGDMLVSVGYKIMEEPCQYLCFYHTEKEPTENGKQILQQALDKTDVLIGHNIKFDYNWLVSCGFTFNGILHDTMVVEYLLAKGLKRTFSLEDSCKRRSVDLKATDLIDPYMKRKISFEHIPWPIVEKYGIQDIEVTWQLAKKQMDKMNLEFEDLWQI